MTTLGHVRRGAQGLGRLLEIRSRSIKPSLSRASTVAQRKIVQGVNGERIIPSVHGDISYPEITLPEYVWRNMGDYPNKIALECGVTGRQYTYAAARDAANCIARSLRNIGFKEGDVIALIAPNYPETVLAFLGALEAGLVVTTVNPFYTKDEISKQLVSSGAKGVITSSEIAPTALAAAKSCLPPGSPLIAIEHGDSSVPDTIPFKDLIERGKTLPPVPSKSSSPDRLAVLPFSSGTTGLPKGVMLTHRNLVSNLEMVHVCTGNEIWQPTTADYQECVPVFLPFFHIFGMNAAAIPSIARGSKVITLPKFAPETLLDVLQKSKATIFFCVPPVVVFLSASPLVKKQHMEHVHTAFSGAAPLAQADVERFYDKFGIEESSLKFCQGYGLTESSPVCFMEISGRKYASIGKNVSGCEVRLVDPNTNEDVSDVGQTGELWVRGPHVMKGYLNNEKATRDTLTEDGWLKTGDIAHFDEHMDFFITDRLKELIKVKGFQVAPAELEAILRTHPDVLEAAVIGIPDARCGEVPKAFVLPKNGKKLTEEDIVNFVKGKVSEYKELKGGVQFTDNIPKNQSGKILRARLKKEYAS